MRTETTSSNPFALMMAPGQVLAAMEKSDALRRLQHRVCHPLDTQPAPCHDAALAAFDAAIERANLVLPEEADDALAA
jgi:hypothetical protein